MIVNIGVTHKEYRDGILTDESKYRVDTQWIANMMQSYPYFTQMGGKMELNFTINRKFGRVPSNIKVVSFCGKVVKTFDLDYQNARIMESNAVSYKVRG